MTEYKIGQLIAIKESMGIIGPNKTVHHWIYGRIGSLGENDTVKGYDTYGLAAYLTMRLKPYFPLDEQTFENEVESSLREIGFHNYIHS